MELLDQGKRVKIEINEENYYLYISDKSLVITCPRENAPDMKHERDAMELISRKVTEIRGGE